MAEGTKFMGCCDLVTVQVVASHQVNMCNIKGYVAAIYNGAWWVAWVTGYVAATYNTGTSTHVWGRDIHTGLGTGVRMPTRIWGLGRDTHTGLGTGEGHPHRFVQVAVWATQTSTKYY